MARSSARWSARRSSSAALGGDATNGTCHVPARARVDWIFGSKGSFGSVSVNQGAQVRRTTDHAIQDAPFTVQ